MSFNRVFSALDVSDKRFKKRLADWTADYDDVFSIENVVGRDFESIAKAVEKAAVCCDTGHLMLEGKSPAEFVGRWGNRVNEIHLHGAVGGKDHHSFGGDEPWFAEMIPFLEEFGGLIHIEIFDYNKIEPVIDLVDRFR